MLIQATTTVTSVHLDWKAFTDASLLIFREINCQNWLPLSHLYAAQYISGATVITRARA